MHSKSRLLAGSAQQQLVVKGHQVKMVDFYVLGQLSSWDQRVLNQVKANISEAQCIVFSTPIYVWDVAHQAKALVEQMPKATFSGKIIGFICSAGSIRSFMAPMNFSNALMINYRAWIVPRFVYAAASDFVDDVASDEINRRIALFCRELTQFASAEANMAIC